MQRLATTGNTEERDRLIERAKKYKNMAEAVLTRGDAEAAEEKAAARLQLKQINDEMRDMLLMAGDTRGAIKEMNEAFNGEAEFDYVEQRT